MPALSLLERGTPREIAEGVWYLPAVMANAYLIRERNGRAFLIDAGVPGSAGWLRFCVNRCLGDGARPEAIVLTHGHFDHVGAVKELAEEWDVPVYAHRMELPYLTGQADYPPPDPTVGGVMAQLSRLFPNHPIDLRGRVREVAEVGGVPALPSWRVVHTPGHSPGHISLFREDDGTLIAGDALITMNQESLPLMVSQRQELHVPPRYFTPDWDAAAESVWKISLLRPNLIASGHGLPMGGEDLQDELHHFAMTFTPPAVGRYVNQSAEFNENGQPTWLPPAIPDPASRLLAGVAAGIIAGSVLWMLTRRPTSASARG